MAEKTQKAMVSELYTVMLGVEGNPEENGFVGEVKESLDGINSRLDQQNGRIRKTENFISWAKGIGASLGIIGTLVGIVWGVLRVLA